MCILLYSVTRKKYTVNSFYFNGRTHSRITSKIQRWKQPCIIPWSFYSRRDGEVILFQDVQDVTWYLRTVCKENTLTAHPGTQRIGTREKQKQPMFKKKYCAKSIDKTKTRVFSKFHPPLVKMIIRFTEQKSGANHKYIENFGATHRNQKKPRKFAIVRWTAMKLPLSR